METLQPSIQKLVAQLLPVISLTHVVILSNAKDL
jgi:hypothetical protein